MAQVHEMYKLNLDEDYPHWKRNAAIRMLIFFPLAYFFLTSVVFNSSVWSGIGSGIANIGDNLGDSLTTVDVRKTAENVGYVGGVSVAAAALFLLIVVGAVALTSYMNRPKPASIWEPAGPNATKVP